MKYAKSIGIYLILFAVAFILYQFMVTKPATTETRVYSEFMQELNQGKLSSLTIESNRITAVRKDKTSFEVAIPSADYAFYMSASDIKEKALENGLRVDFKVDSTSWWEYVVPYMFPLLIIIIFWIIMFRQQGGAGKAMSFGKSRAKLMTEKDRVVTFSDVAGADEEKQDLEEIVTFLKSPKKYTDIGARIPKGVLLVGPPGTGKTLLARAVAGEAGVSFFSISGSDFVEMFVGVGASRVRDLFEQAKKSLPAVIFIDEIDAVGRHRGAGIGGGNDEREQTLNQLLVEMDGFGANSGIIIIAATNRPDILDPALMRPGRFDRQVVVNIPDLKGREEILKVHGRNKKFAKAVSFLTIAKTTAGFTGADLENLLNESAILAVRDGKKEIDMSAIQQALMKVMMGNEKKSRIMTEKEKRLTAIHEAGHAIITRLLPSQDAVHEVSIIPRGMAGGYTMHIPTDEKSYETKLSMLDAVKVLLGGRASEQLKLGDISTGASNDIERATDIARKMVMRYGMSDALGPIAYGSSNDEVFLGKEWTQAKNYSETVAAEIDVQVRKIITHAYEETLNLLRENDDKLENVSQCLLEFEKLNGDEFEHAFNGEKIDRTFYNNTDENKENTENNDAAPSEIKPAPSTEPSVNNDEKQTEENSDGE
ncbi:MAG: ATP-dependent zinc metalloprotease FtsH [Bacillota bacterium]|nr:ATP-dependent zinc metalloprotease FtsH [Bacillota bacterium]